MVSKHYENDNPLILTSEVFKKETFVCSYMYTIYIKLNINTPGPGDANETLNDLSSSILVGSDVSEDSLSLFKVSAIFLLADSVMIIDLKKFQFKNPCVDYKSFC